jgi:hypothetical protein
VHDDGGDDMSMVPAEVPSTGDRDRGSVLPLVLVFMVIGSLIIVPMLAYASTVLRANGVAVEKTEDMEQLRGGTRVAVADPADLFVRCSGGTTGVPVAGSLVPGTSTVCREVSRVAVLDELEVPYGAVAIQLGETVPAEFSYSTAQPAPADGTNWWGDPGDPTSCVTWCPDPKQDTIWMPPLPEVASSVQEATGYPMPPPRDCTVYFPGRYTSPVLLDGPTYFVSGVYYFEDTLTVVGGADVVMGFGLAEGCVGNDAAAVLDMYPNPLPPTLNAEGNGATLLFGDEGRLIIDDSVKGDGAGGLTANTGDPLRFEINQRYIQDVSDTAARVSIMSVNGDLDEVSPGPPPVTTTGPLDVPDVIYMPESVVKTSTGSFELASAKGLTPSSLTAEPRPPEPPTGVSAVPYDDDLINPSGKGAIRVKWNPPVGNDEGGSTITQYTVTSVPDGQTCTTDGATECVLRDINHGVLNTISVTATNAIGTSGPSSPATATTAGPDPNLTAPDPVTAVTIADPATWLDQAEVSWTAPANDGNAPIVGYRVEAFREYQDFTDPLNVLDLSEPAPISTCETWSFRDQPPATSCVVDNLPPLDTTPGNGPVPLVTTWLGYHFHVIAINAVTNEGLPVTPLDPSLIVGETEVDAPYAAIPAFTGTTTYVDTTPFPPVWPVAPTYVPDPILDVSLTGVAASYVNIDGYVAVPQGRVRVNNPTGQPTDLIGGFVAGSYSIDAATLATMGTPTSPTKIGFEDVILQRTIELVTSAAGSKLTSTMRVQINANGADMVVNSWVIQ